MILDGWVTRTAGVAWVAKPAKLVAALRTSGNHATVLGPQNNPPAFRAPTPVSNNSAVANNEGQA
jgi:hypothetical protein